MSNVIALDTETFYIKSKPTDPGYSVSKMGNWRYCNDPRFDCYMLSVCDGSEAWAGHPKDFNWASLDGATLLSHNKGFDAAVCRRMTEQGIAPKLENEWLCTANMTSFLCNRRALDSSVRHLMGIRVEKGMRDWMSGKTWEEAQIAGKTIEMQDYAKGDVINCHKLFTRFQHLWTPTERALSQLTIDQSTRGCAVDIQKLFRYKSAVGTLLWQIEQTLPWTFEGEKVTSTKAIAEQCRRVGIPCPPVKSHDGGEEKFILWEETYAPKFSWIANVSRYRSINVILNTLETIIQRLRPDGTIDYSLLYYGAHTGRWSGGGGGLNMQNLLKLPIYILDDWSCYSEDSELWNRLEQENINVQAALDADKKLSLGKLFEIVFEKSIREKIDMRSLFIPRPGHQFVICDLAQIEPRVLNWLCGNHELLNRLRTGMSIYEAHARDTMGWTGGELKKESPTLYKAAKARVLGLGYGCGKAKFKTVAKVLADYDITAEESAGMVEDFRAANPKITGLWYKLDDRFRASFGSDFEMGLPSGRVMRYEGVTRSSRPYKNKETGEVGFRMVFTADVGGDRYMFYGGMLAENLTQATSRDVFGEHLLELKRQGIPTLFHAHDEAVTEVPLGTDKREVEQIMSKTPEWLEGCPIAAEAVVAKHYLK